MLLQYSVCAHVCGHCAARALRCRLRSLHVCARVFTCVHVCARFLSAFCNTRLPIPSTRVPLLRFTVVYLQPTLEGMLAFPGTVDCLDEKTGNRPLHIAAQVCIR